MQTKLYDVYNKSNNIMHIAASNKKEAINIALKLKHIKSIINVKVKELSINSFDINQQYSLTKALIKGSKGQGIVILPKGEWKFLT